MRRDERESIQGWGAGALGARWARRVGVLSVHVQPCVQRRRPRAGAARVGSDA
jgi:hypothetical protein